MHSYPTPDLLIRICVLTNYFVKCTIYNTQTEHTCPEQSTVPLKYLFKQKYTFKGDFIMIFRKLAAADKVAKDLD